MSIFVYRTAASSSARELATALNGRRVRETNNLRRLLRTGDFVVCWGERLAPIHGVHILNGGPLANKMEDAIKLRQERVPTVEVSRNPGFTTRPPAEHDQVRPLWTEAMEAAEAFTEVQYDRTSQILRDGVGQLHGLLGRLHTALLRPLPPEVQPVEWLGRTTHHTGGLDLLNPTPEPEYYVKKENLVHEYRVHSFQGRSIRAGVKTHRDGFQNPHAWIRSWDAGWRISYDGATVRQTHRDLAHRACRALGLDFGGVDIGQKADGTLLVLEVNRACGLEGGTIEAYADAIRGWINGPRRT